MTEKTPSASDLKLILFDCDGTLCDSENFLRRSIFSAFEQHQADKILEQHLPAFFSQPTGVFMRSLENIIGAEKSRKIFDTFIETLEHERSNSPQLEPTYPGIIPLLDNLIERQYILGIATNKGRQGLDYFLTSNQLKGYFSTLQHSQNSTPKPAPQMVDNALYETGIARENCLLVGDTIADVLLAQNAGIKMIGVQWGDVVRLPDDGSVNIIRDPSHLINEIEKSWL